MPSGKQVILLFNTTLYEKYVDPYLKVSIYGSVLNPCIYHPVVFPLNPIIATLFYYEKNTNWSICICISNQEFNFKRLFWNIEEWDVFESEICEMLQFMHVKILFLKFSLCQGTLRDGRRGPQGEGRQAG